MKNLFSMTFGILGIICMLLSIYCLFTLDLSDFKSQLIFGGYLVSGCAAAVVFILLSNPKNFK